VSEAKRIHREDVQICEGIGRHGAPLIQPGSRVLTHCNAGALAVTGIGTATAPLYARHSQGIQFKVFADETRPLYQGARLTAWELDQAGIDVTVLCDNAAASLMDRGNIDLVIVGTDRVTENGDVVNKIGTLNVAILCQHFGIPMYVACPSSTYDAQTPTGSDVKIEQRDEVEVLGDHAAHVRAVNPAFDVTPAHMITGIITEHGISTNPRALAPQVIFNEFESIFTPIDFTVDSHGRGTENPIHECGVGVLRDLLPNRRRVCQLNKFVSIHPHGSHR